mmetsp:Transcript_11320/g.28445  ORF Transcript_11320/g.28445 Transcript_11320/m.28445 type:complete len:273 (-) Transcript_11320:1095-1913(-)
MAKPHPPSPQCTKLELRVVRASDSVDVALASRDALQSRNIEGLVATAVVASRTTALTKATPEVDKLSAELARGTRLALPSSPPTRRHLETAGVDLRGAELPGVEHCHGAPDCCEGCRPSSRAGQRVQLRGRQVLGVVVKDAPVFLIAGSGLEPAGVPPAHHATVEGWCVEQRGAVPVLQGGVRVVVGRRGHQALPHNGAVPHWHPCDVPHPIRVRRHFCRLHDHAHDILTAPHPLQDRVQQPRRCDGGAPDHSPNIVEHGTRTGHCHTVAQF